MVNKGVYQWYQSQQNQWLLFGNLLDKSRATMGVKYTRQLPVLFEDWFNINMKALQVPGEVGES